VSRDLKRQPIRGIQAYRSSNESDTPLQYFENLSFVKRKATLLWIKILCDPEQQAYQSGSIFKLKIAFGKD